VSEKRATGLTNLSFGSAFLEGPLKTGVRASLQHDPKTMRARRIFGSRIRAHRDRIQSS
jgi:hypothetical protein